MAYVLKAFIGKKKNLKGIEKEYQSAKIVELKNNYCIIPVTNSLFNEINKMRLSTKTNFYFYLTKDFENDILEIVLNKKIAYVESEYFGGNGGHLGVVWENGKRIYDGKLHKKTLNEILKVLGVKKSLFKDEFETLGLNKHRFTENWLDEYKN